MNIFDSILLAITESRGFHVNQEPPGWVSSLGGWDTSSGVDVSPEDALGLTAVFACIRILAESVASLPLHIYKRLPNGGKARAVEHPMYAVLHNLANAEMTAFEVREVLMGHVGGWGNAYAEIELDRGGRVRGLWPLRPDKMTVSRENMALTYTYRLPKPDEQGRTQRVFSADRILHIHGLGFDGIQGYSPIQLARQAVGLGLATEEFGARFFGNDARPGMVLQHPGKLGDEAHKRLQKSWQTSHGGLDKSHRVAILEEGLTIKEIGIPPEDAQFLQTRKFQIAEIARLYRIPPHMLADLDRATFSNIEHQSLEFVIHSLRPWLVRWEQAIQHKLFTENERRQYFAEFLVDGLLRGDIKSRYEAYSIGRQNGWLSANDVRELENMNPVDGGDVYLVPLNMIPADQVGGFGMPGMESDSGQRSLSPGDMRAVLHEQRVVGLARQRHRLMKANYMLYKDIAARFIRREVNDVLRSARKLLGQRDVPEFGQWLGDFYKDHTEFVGRQVRPLARSYGEMVASVAQEEIGSEQGLTPELDRWIESYVSAFALRHSSISEARIRMIVDTAIASGEDPLQALELTLGEWEEQRSSETARWESVRFGNAIAVAVYLFGGRQFLRWVNTGSESCPYCENLDGQIVGINQNFIDAGTDFQPDGAERPLHVGHNVRHAPAHDGCDCMVVSA